MPSLALSPLQTLKVIFERQSLSLQAKAGGSMKFPTATASGAAIKQQGAAIQQQGAAIQQQGAAVRHLLDTVLLQQPVERTATNAECLGSAGLVALVASIDLFNMQLVQAIQIELAAHFQIG